VSTAFQPATPAEVSTVTVDRVEQKTINRRDGTSGTLYQVYVVGAIAPLETFKRDIAESAFSLVGQDAEAHYTVKVNGNFTNYRLEQILPGKPSPAEVAQRAQEAGPLLREAAGLPTPPVASQGLPAAPTDKDKSIHRQTAAKVAATLFAANPSDAPTFWENIRLLAHYFDTGDIPGTTTPELQGGGEGYFDDIPFMPTL